jgi:hypothetical protein
MLLVQFSAVLHMITLRPSSSRRPGEQIQIPVTISQEQTMIFGGKGDSEKIGKLEARIEKLEAENKRLRDALGFYADPENWTQGHKYKDLDDATIFQDKDARGVDADHGGKAIQALKDSN